MENTANSNSGTFCTNKKCSGVVKFEVGQCVTLYGALKGHGGGKKF